MKALALPVLAAVLAFPLQAQSLSWNLDDRDDADEAGNTLLFTGGSIGLAATSWSHPQGKRHAGFEAAEGQIHPTGLGITNGRESGGLEHQIDNSRGNDWVLLVFDAPVTDVKLVVNPYGIWDRDVTYYTASISGSVDLTGLTYTDLSGLGFSERTDDLSDRSQFSREVAIAADGAFNVVLVGAQQGKPGFGSVDRFKLSSVGATMNVVPEPSAFLLCSLAGGGMMLRRRRRATP